jgi:hypothetical protein
MDQRLDNLAAHLESPGSRRSARNAVRNMQTRGKPSARAQIVALKMRAFVLSIAAEKSLARPDFSSNRSGEWPITAEKEQGIPSVFLRLQTLCCLRSSHRVEITAWADRMRRALSGSMAFDEQDPQPLMLGEDRPSDRLRGLQSLMGQCAPPSASARKFHREYRFPCEG